MTPGGVESDEGGSAEQVDYADDDEGGSAEQVDYADDEPVVNCPAER
jgi:hypothetical protein